MSAEGRHYARAAANCEAVYAVKVFGEPFGILEQLSYTVIIVLIACQQMDGITHALTITALSLLSSLF